MKTTSCRACNKQIGFVLNRTTGRRIPVDPVSVMRTETDSAKNPYKTLITDQGETLKDPAVGTVGYTPHWVTCDNPARFRKNRKGARL